jgi:hypothetical protein
MRPPSRQAFASMPIPCLLQAAFTMTHHGLIHFRRKLAFPVSAILCLAM